MLCGLVEREECRASQGEKHLQPMSQRAPFPMSSHKPIKPVASWEGGPRSGTGREGRSRDLTLSGREGETHGNHSEKLLLAVIVELL